MKTLKEILQLEVYEPKSPDEKRFKDKHVVVKHKDANGNDDDLFNAKNIKTVDREPMHGYNPGEDEKVYEEVEELDERQMKAGNIYAIATAQVKKKHGLTGKNVDLTKAQTIEAHQLAKKIAKRMGVSLKESKELDTARETFAATTKMGPPIKGVPGPGKPGAAKVRAAAKAAAKAASPSAETTNQRMIKKLGLPTTIRLSPENYGTQEFKVDPNRKMSDKEELIQLPGGRRVIVPIGAATVKRKPRSKK